MDPHTTRKKFNYFHLSPYFLSSCCTIRGSSEILPRSPAAILIPVPLCVQSVDYLWQVTVIHWGWKDTSLFGLWACCAFSTGHKREADIKRPHRTGPLLPLFHQIHSCPHLPFLCSRFYRSQTPTTNITEQSFGSLTLEISTFSPLFSSLKLKMMTHLDNAPILQWTPSYPALDGTSCNHILWFFLFASCSR